MQYVGIHTQQSRNNRRSVFLLFLFPCLVAALLYLACYLLVALGHDQSLIYQCPPLHNGHRTDLVPDCFLDEYKHYQSCHRCKAARPQGEQTCLQSGREPLHGERNEDS